MSRKRIAVILVGVLGVMAATLVLTGPLHSGDSAEAQAPPQTFWKVSMPDLGQHSTGWCWAAAAANSFWWYADNVAGQEGLLGGVAKPWKAIDPASTNPGSVCGTMPPAGFWFDSRDPIDGSAVLGYPTVLSMIAQTTFYDVNQDGVQDPDGADNIPGTADDEDNYCYSEGVEKWDYLIGLRDYVEAYGSGLKVHDIIDQARCGIGTGLIVNRGVPTLNSRDPCGLGGSGVPRVNQTVKVGGPDFADYMDQMSAGQDVLLWMEPGPGNYLETAHVVTGVGYDNTQGIGFFGKGTLTISDPWTHTTNPPLPPVASVSHNDFLPGPWQGKPDHDTSGTHQALPSTDPYNLCDVSSGVNPLQIQCYDEDTGAPILWNVVDMIFVSPEQLVVDKQVNDVALDDGRSYPQPGTELTLISEDPATRTSNYAYATNDPDFKYLKSTNVPVSVTSYDMNLGPDVPEDAYVSFLADVPAGCEGRWIPQTTPDGLHTDTLTTADYIADLNDPLGQTGGTIINPQDPLYNQKISGDGDPHTIESDLHFQTADWGLLEEPGLELPLLRFFEFHCYDTADKVFTFYNKIEPEPLDTDLDPNLTNNWWKATMLVQPLHNADIKILSWSATTPPEGELGVPFQIRADEVKHNNGPQGAFSSVSWTAQEPAGGQVSARWIPQTGDTQPSDEVLQFQVDLTEISTDLVLSRSLELTCNVVGGPYTVTLINDEWPIDPNPPHDPWEDPVPGNNSATTTVQVTCTQGGTQEIKWQQLPDESPLGLDVDDTHFVLAEDFQCTESGMITQIDFWGSWYHDGLPLGGPNAVAFTVSLHSDVPAGGEPPWSHPDEVLWMHTFAPFECMVQPWSQGQEGWLTPPDVYEAFADTQIWFYSCPIPPAEWFQQAEGTIYWLDIQAAPQGDAWFGWKTSVQHWNDDGVWAMPPEPVPPPNWSELRYPPGHPMFPESIDLAFQVQGQPCAPGVDSDADTFNDDVECYLPTDSRDNCTNNPGVHDAWPLDINMDKAVTVPGDVLNFAGRLGSEPGMPNWRQRLDLNADSAITVPGDVLKFAGKLGAECS